MTFICEGASVLIVRQPLRGDAQADYDAATDILTIDNKVPLQGLAPIIAEVLAYLLGAPSSYVRPRRQHQRRRDHLALVRTAHDEVG